MLDRFTRSPVAAALAAADVERWFELPFAWDWDGVPVHGSIDLVYRDASGWHVIDFKSDRLNGTSAQEAASHYACRSASTSAPSRPPSASRRAPGLLFLRSGELARPEPAEVEAALAEARERVNAGVLLEPPTPGSSTSRSSHCRASPRPRTRRRGSRRRAHPHALYEPVARSWFPWSEPLQGRITQ